MLLENSRWLPFCKMADMSGKEIIKFAKNVPAYLSIWDDHDVKSYSLERVENEFGHYSEASFCHNFS